MNQRDRMKLALETGYSLPTVIKWDLGRPVLESTDKALLRATSELGLVRENEDHDTERS